MNTYAYAGSNPIKYVDPTGEFFFLPALPAIGGISSGALGHLLGITIVGAVIADIVDDLNDREDDDGISVPVPPQNKGRYTCICRVQADGRSPDNCTENNKQFAYGYGEGPTLRTAKRAAEKMAKDILGARSTHHPQCRCTDLKGEPVRPHG